MLGEGVRRIAEMRVLFFEARSMGFGVRTLVCMISETLCGKRPPLRFPAPRGSTLLSLVHSDNIVAFIGNRFLMYHSPLSNLKFY